MYNQRHKEPPSAKEVARQARRRQAAVVATMASRLLTVRQALKLHRANLDELASWHRAARLIQRK
jgi:hypothetical protein